MTNVEIHLLASATLFMLKLAGQTTGPLESLPIFTLWLFLFVYKKHSTHIIFSYYIKISQWVHLMTA